MMYLYMKLEVKKHDITAMTTAINEACNGWLHENCYLVRGIFLVWEMSISFAAGGILPPPPSIYSVSPKRKKG